MSETNNENSNQEDENSSTNENSNAEQGTSEGNPSTEDPVIIDRPATLKKKPRN